MRIEMESELLMVYLRHFVSLGDYEQAQEAWDPWTPHATQAGRPANTNTATKTRNKSNLKQHLYALWNSKKWHKVI
eukprot:g77891.t1